MRASKLRATRYHSATHLEWQSGYQPQTIGFRIYREQNGHKVLISPNVIAGPAMLSGARLALRADRPYSWWDGPTDSGTRYWIEELTLKGHTFYGPVSASLSDDSKLRPGNKEFSPLLLQSAQRERPAPSLIVRPAGAARAAHATMRPVIASQAVNLFGQNAIKVSVSQAGWYEIPLRTLIGNGLRVPAGRLHLYAEGNEVPFELRAGSVQFYGTPIDTPTAGTRVYWLGQGAPNRNHIGLSKARETTSAGDDFLNSVELLQRTNYFPSANSPSGIDFYGDAIINAASEMLTVTNLSRPDNAQLEVGLQGVTPGAHSITVALNGTTLGVMTFDDQTNSTMSFPAPEVVNGANTVTLTAGNSGDISFLDHITLSYEQSYAAINDALQFSAPGGTQVTLSGFTTAKMRMIDITNPAAPQELRVRPHRVPHTTNFTAAASMPAGGQRTILAFGPTEVATPDSLTLHKAAQLTPFANSVDTIMIAPSQLLAGLQPLIALRQLQGLSVIAVDLQEVYDAFSFGEKDPQAIRDFLAATQSASQVPHYLLLVGNATYDPRNFLGAPSVSVPNLDLLPTKLINADDTQVASDGWFSDFANTIQPQIATGRLPVMDGAGLTAMINKIIAYDNSSSASNNFLLAADNEQGFVDASDTLLPLLPAGANATSLERSDTNQPQLLSAIGSGPSLVNYIGHGNINSWGSPIQGWLSDTDAPALSNTTHPAFFAMMTCLSGYFIEPHLNSLAESLLTADGGAIAVWASSGITVPDGQVQADQALYQLLYGSGQPPLLGEAVRQAQNQSSDPDVRQTWNLLGDPETRLK